MAFLQDWKKAKTAFEAATKTSKPSEKFLGVFRKSSGLEEACKELDSALAAPTVANLAKAEATFDKTAEAYVALLRKSAKTESSAAAYNAELKKLEKALENIRIEYSKRKREGLARAPRTFGEIIPGEVIEALAKSKFPTQPGVRTFATQAGFALSGVDGKTPLAGAAAAQKEAQTALKNYLVAIQAIIAQKTVVMEPKKAWKKAYDIFTDAALAVGQMEGCLMALANWTAAQENAFRKAGRFDEFLSWLKTGPLSGAAKQAGKEANDELARLNRYEVLCDKNR